MKNIKHHTIIITVKDFKTAEKIKNEISILFKKNMEAKNGFELVSPIIPGLINNYYSFFISPDGSKEGYDLSDDGDKIREKTIKLLDKYLMSDSMLELNYVELYYGDENSIPRILNYK
ncbi:MAG: hypothetical protein EAZ27_01280 [Cytophagales bacterium]|nr:MAG: hypothetical protein EAZ27_01280 [Cytophagales bacterium]